MNEQNERPPGALMPKRMFQLLVASMVLCIAAAILWRNSQPIARARLIPNREWRVVQVSFGTNHLFTTENLWERCVRKVVPDAWQKSLGPYKGERVQTPLDSLVVWMQEINQATDQPQTFSFGKGEAMLADGSFARGNKRGTQTAVTSFEFRSFDREAKQVTFRVYDGSIPVTFTIDNPHPARRARWNAAPLPHTNHLPGTDVILRQMRTSSAINGYEASLLSRAVLDAKSGWVAWRLTAIDPTGNWTEGNRMMSAGQPRIAVLPTHSTTWKLIADGQEYISAAFVTMPTNGAVVLPINLRAQRAGVKFLMLTSGGACRIADGIISNTSASISNQPPLTFRPANGQTNWALEVNSSSVGVLCVFEPSGEGQLLGVRLRERLPPDAGRIFPMTMAKSVSDFASRVSQVATLYSPRLPMTTTNLELEIIRALPPAEFFIASP